MSKIKDHLMDIEEKIFDAVECDCPRQIKYTIVRDVIDVPVACPFCRKVIV